MKPQLQTRKEKNGDCLRACIATLLEVKIDKVPDFVQAPEVPGSDLPGWWIALQSWLADRGLFFIEVGLPANFQWLPVVLPSLCILFGETTTGIKHAIVGRCEGGDFFPEFNPWPEAEFADGVGALGFLIPRDPNMVMQMGRSLDNILKLTKGFMVGNDIGDAIRVEAATALGYSTRIVFNGAKVNPTPEEEPRS